uniref:NADH-ubiquinone oxidoreductase chain 3 n=1 Tax=Arge similis TaxID=621222 RepID=A0A3Q8U9U1_9HYME|nr:NADH dehydrogenase subunit 3 [Arge similis]
MKMMIFSSIMIIMLSMLIMLITSMLSKKSFYDREKNSPFECGFDPKGSPRMPFSIHFFMISVIFIIFDVEITLLLPLIKLMKINENNSWLMLMLFFMMILMLGLLYEWNYGALNWMN